MPTAPAVLLQRATALQTFCYAIDLKLGSEIITYFAILNKVAGVYGLLAVFFGGNLAQLSLYLYSVATLLACAWGLRQIGEENAARTTTYAHLYLLDHAVSTLYTVYFGVVWYIYNPHDGRRDATTQARKELLAGHTTVDDAGSALDTGESDAERARKALGVWNDEKGFATGVLVLGWLLKVSCK